jgi:ADP-ribose pyrophosphatase
VAIAVLEQLGKKGEIVSEKAIYQGPIFKLVQQEIQTPDQMTVKRDVVFHKPAVAVLALTPDQKVVVNVEYRAGVNQESLALPAGLLNEGETPLIAAKRELQEETGYVARDLQIMTTVASSEGFTDEKVTLVLAQIETDQKAAKNFDRDEFVTSGLMAYQDLRTRIQTGTVASAQTVSAVGFYELFCRK